ncbi:hypothetical protein Tco_1338581 [Tanacetum coccineum]
MVNSNPSCSTSNREFLDPKKMKKIESRLVDSMIINSLDGTNEIEHFDTFPTMKELEYHEWLLKYPKPSWVKAKIRTENFNNVKISCKIGRFLKRQAYINLESPINVISKKHYNEIMNKGLESRLKPSNPSKNSNFVRRVKDKLYLMRRSLEVLRKFHWMILGGRFNQLSHVSSPLLSKPGEY